MKKNRRKMTQEEYLQEFKLNLSTFENERPDLLFKEWPIDVKFFKDNKDDKPIFTIKSQLKMYILSGIKMYNHSANAIQSFNL